MSTLAALDLAPFWLSFRLAAVTTLILFLLSLPLAWWLSQTHSRAKPLVESLTALPIVLPPSVLGFYLLWALAPNSPVGAFFEQTFGIKLVFRASLKIDHTHNIESFCLGKADL